MPEPESGLPPTPPRLLEVHEVAYYLKSSPEMVLRLLRAKKLHGIHPFGPRNWRVDARDLQAYIDGLRAANHNGNGNGNGHGNEEEST